MFGALRKRALAGAVLLGAVGLAGRDMMAQQGVAPAPKAPAQPMYEPKETDPVLNRVLTRWPEGRIDTNKHPGEWSYEEGTLLDGMMAEWRQTGDGRLFAYVKAAVDHAVDKDGVIHMADGKGFPVDGHSMDDVEMGRSVVALYRVTLDPRYYKAATFLYQQMLKQPKNSAGGYWHKQIYPNQMWLDGAYMSEPFMAAYARTFHHPELFADVATQLLLMDENMRNRGNGLLFHGWDASKQMDWANKKTGLSPEVWARAMGWYCMALVDVLERMPETDPQRLAVEDAARRALTAVAHFQDKDSGLWWEVMDKGGQEGNYLESSASCMFVYAMAKAMRLGIVGFQFEENITQGWSGIQSHFVKPDGTLGGTVSVGGLGGNPYRSGTYQYYLTEKVVENDAKGVGAYLMALSEITQHERVKDVIRRVRGKTVLFDGWFNSQQRKNADGKMEPFHYKYNDDANSGYSTWARMFQQYGMRVDSLDHAPTAEDLKSVSIYILVSPDIEKLNPMPHFMDTASADVIEAWVKDGGVLAMMENDSQNSEFEHFDILADRFGMHFNAVRRNEEIDNSYANTMVPIPAGTGGIFRDDHKATMKETSTITVKGPARVVLTDKGQQTEKGDVFMAVANVGKGWVYGNVDPWIYNEYTDGRKAPLGEDNFAGGQELTRWLVLESIH